MAESVVDSEERGIYCLSHDPTLPQILSGLSFEAAHCLDSHGVYDVMAYGWIDHDTIDSNYFGHALWQTNPPFEPDWTAISNGGSITHAPTAADEVLTLNGEDFIGTMMFARRSIGLALCYAAGVDSESLDSKEEFWHHYTTSLQWLNIASDRLRDFFVMAAFRKTRKQYEQDSEQPRDYSGPFKRALQQPDDLGNKHLTALMPIAVGIPGQGERRFRDDSERCYGMISNTIPG